MKTTFLNKSYIVLFCFLSFSLLFSCKKPDPPAPPVATGTLAFHLHTDVDTTEVDVLGQVYKLSTGRQISVNFAQLYLSHIQLIKLDGSTYEVPDMIILKNQPNEVYTVGNVPIGNYKSVQFYVGLDASADQYAPTSDTVLNHPNMWFDSTGATGAGWGYKFINFQGMIDTTAGGQGPISSMKPFQIKLGGSAAYKLITMPAQNFTITQNEVTFVHMIINYAYLFHGVDLTKAANLSIQNPGENLSVQNAIMDANITAAASTSTTQPMAMFTYEY